MLYRSRWDLWTWLIVIFMEICCLLPCFAGVGFIVSSILVIISILFLLLFIGTYYRIEGNELIVYVFFRPSAFPIDKIKEIRPTSSMLSSPATALTKRIAISFTDRSILKSADPLIISPVHKDDFIRQLLFINPKIKHKDSLSDTRP